MGELQRKILISIITFIVGIIMTAVLSKTGLNPVANEAIKQASKESVKVVAEEVIPKATEKQIDSSTNKPTETPSKTILENSTRSYMKNKTEIPDSNTPDNKNAKPEIIENVYYGIANNTTFYKFSYLNIKFTMDTNKNILTAIGQFDCKNLFGRFSLPGSYCKDPATNNTIAEFRGQFFVGDDGSGFPSNTNTDFYMKILVDTQERITGNFTIGYLPNINFFQYGNFSLRRIK